MDIRNRIVGTGVASCAVVVAILLAGCASSGNRYPQTGSPPPTPSTSRSPTNTAPGLAAPDARTPTTTACARAGGPTISITVGADGPSPRCVRVSAGQQLRVVNHTGASAITVLWADYPSRSVPRGQATVYDQPFGRYLAPGVHNLQISAYPPGAPEIWLL